jgi:hypothetical protein
MTENCVNGLLTMRFIGSFRKKEKLFESLEVSNAQCYDESL